MFRILHLIDCLPPFCLVIFLKFCPDLSSGTCFFVSSFGCLPMFISVFGISATSPNLGRVALCSRLPLGPSVAACVHLNQVLLGCLMFGVCMLSCCSWALIAIGTSVCGTASPAELGSHFIMFTCGCGTSQFHFSLLPALWWHFLKKYVFIDFRKRM